MTDREELRELHLHRCQTTWIRYSQMKLLSDRMIGNANRAAVKQRAEQIYEEFERHVDAALNDAEKFGFTFKESWA